MSLNDHLSIRDSTLNITCTSCQKFNIRKIRVWNRETVFQSFVNSYDLK